MFISFRTLNIVNELLIQIGKFIRHLYELDVTKMQPRGILFSVQIRVICHSENIAALEH